MEPAAIREADAKAILTAKGWLTSEPAWLREAMLKNGALQTYRPGEHTHFAGDESGGMFGVAAGSFGVMIPAATGELVLSHVLRTGVWFGLGPVLTNGPRSLTYRAMETSHVLHVSQADINKIAHAHPEFYRRIGMLSEGSYYAMAIRVLGDLLVRSGEQRIAAVLTRLAGSGMNEGQQASVELKLTQAEIGQISNTSRDRVNRVLQKFAKAGWVELDYRGIVIRDLAALQGFIQRDRDRS